MRRNNEIIRGQPPWQNFLELRLHPSKRVQHSISWYLIRMVSTSQTDTEIYVTRTENGSEKQVQISAKAQQQLLVDYFEM